MIRFGVLVPDCVRLQPERIKETSFFFVRSASCKQIVYLHSGQSRRRTRYAKHTGTIYSCDSQRSNKLATTRAHKETNWPIWHNSFGNFRLVRRQIESLNCAPLFRRLRPTLTRKRSRTPKERARLPFEKVILITLYMIEWPSGKLAQSIFIFMCVKL